MLPDPDACYRAVASRDVRFDGWFVVAVTSTGIYCRPSCPALTPKRENVRFHPGAAAAQRAGFRACKRCRPDATPGSPEWNVRGDLVARAMRLVADGVVDREGVPGLAARLGYSERQVHRQLVAEVGAGPLALARTQRASTARVLVETTDLPLGEVAFAAGFASIRAFNETVRGVFAATPTALRAAARRTVDGAGPGSAGAPAALTLRLPYREPMAADWVLRFHGVRAVPGLEDYDGASFRRVLALPHGPGVAALGTGAGHVVATLRLTDLRDLTAAVQRCRRLLDLDADPVAVADVLGADPALGPLTRRTPGLRVPGGPDAVELAVRVIVGQQVSEAGARAVVGRIVAACGKPLTTADGALTHLFPDAATLAAVDPAQLPLPRQRARAVVALARAVADGRLRLDSGVDRAEARQALLGLPGVGPWTADAIGMRALGDPDAFLPTDLGVRRAAGRLGLPTDPDELIAISRAWRPWRAYAVLTLWSSLWSATPSRPARSATSSSPPAPTGSRSPGST